MIGEGERWRGERERGRYYKLLQRLFRASPRAGKRFWNASALPGFAVHVHLIVFHGFTREFIFSVDQGTNNEEDAVCNMINCEIFFIIRGFVKSVSYNVVGQGFESWT